MRLSLILGAILSTVIIGCDAPRGDSANSSNPPASPPAPMVPPPPPGATSSSVAPPSAADGTPATSELTASEKRSGFSLKTYAGKQPVLVLFNGSQDQTYQRFNEALNQQQAGVDQHGLVVIEVFDTMRASPSGRIRNGESLSPEAATNLMDGLAGGGGSFKLVLIGKDGKIVSRGGYTEPSQILAQLNTDEPAMP